MYLLNRNTQRNKQGNNIMNIESAISSLVVIQIVKNGYRKEKESLEAFARKSARVTESVMEFEGDEGNFGEDAFIAPLDYEIIEGLMVGYILENGEIIDCELIYSGDKNVEFLQDNACKMSDHEILALLSNAGINN